MSTQQIKLDKMDFQILNILQKNAKVSYKDIAEQLHLSRTPIFERVKKMEKAGIIKQYVTLIDTKKLGHNQIIICNIRLKEHGTDAVSKFKELVSKLPQIMECYHIAGDYDFIMKIIVQSMSDYQEFVLNEFNSENNILKVHSSFVMGELKEGTFLEL